MLSDLSSRSSRLSDVSYFSILRSRCSIGYFISPIFPLPALQTVLSLKVGLSKVETSRTSSDVLDHSRSNNFQSLPFDTSVLSYQYRNNRHYEFFRNSECRSDKFYGSYSLLLLINAFLAKIYIFNRTLCHSRLKDSFQSIHSAHFLGNLGTIK